MVDLMMILMILMMILMILMMILMILMMILMILMMTMPVFETLSTELNDFWASRSEIVSAFRFSWSQGLIPSILDQNYIFP